MTLKSSTEWQMFLMTLKIYHHRSHLHILNMNHFVPVVLCVCAKLKQQRICYFPYLIQTMTEWVLHFLNTFVLFTLKFSQISFLYFMISFLPHLPPFDSFFPTRFRAHGKQNPNKVLFAEAKKKPRYILLCTHLVYSLAFWNSSFKLSSVLSSFHFNNLFFFYFVLPFFPLLLLLLLCHTQRANQNFFFKMYTNSFNLPAKLWVDSSS